MPPDDDGSLTAGERMERIENGLEKVLERLRYVELRIVWISATIAAVVSFGSIILSFVVVR